MTQGDLNVAVEAAKKAIEPKLTGLARMYKGTIFDMLPDLCRDVVEAVDDHRKSKIDAKDSDTNGWPERWPDTVTVRS